MNTNDDRTQGGGLVQLLPRLATAIIVVIVVIAGAIVVIVAPDTLAFDQYIKDVGVAAGLLSIGYGLDSRSRP